MIKRLIIIISLFSAPLLYAGEADVIKVIFSRSFRTVFNFKVTVRHGDSGWKHYADAWEVLDMRGNLLAKRVLYHPHVDEQPFTRSLKDVKIPGSIKRVMIRAHCSVHEYGGKFVIVDIRK